MGKLEGRRVSESGARGPAASPPSPDNGPSIRGRVESQEERIRFWRERLAKQEENNRRLLGIVEQLEAQSNRALRAKQRAQAAQMAIRTMVSEILAENG